MSLSMGISDETEVAMIAIDETPVSQIKATILLPFQSRLTKTGVRFGYDEGKGICQELCYTSRVFAVLIKPVVFFISSFLTSLSWLHSISPVTLQRKRVLDMRRFL